MGDDEARRAGGGAGGGDEGGGADSFFPPEDDRVPADSTRRDPATRDRRRRLEGVIPEIVRRAVELGVEKAQEAPDNLKQFVGDMKVPKDIAHYLLAQVDETKNGLFRVVAKEIRDFLEHTNFAGEVQKLLTTVQFEVNTTIRFTPNDGRSKKRDKSDKSDRSDEGERDGDPDGERDDDPDASASDDDDRARRSTPLPRPEVKTAVHVRRDEPKRRSRDRGT
jgi:hypothetical protein